MIKVDGLIKTELFYPTSLKTVHNFNCLPDSNLAEINKELPLISLQHTDPMQLKPECELCGNNVKLGLYHTNPLKNLPKNLTPMQRAVFRKNRKCITVCFICQRHKLHSQKNIKCN